MMFHRKTARRRAPVARKPRLCSVLTAALVLPLAACTVGPRYQRPPVVTPPAYQASKDWKIAEPGDGVPRGKWWMIFGDPLLDQLTEDIEQ